MPGVLDGLDSPVPIKPPAPKPLPAPTPAKPTGGAGFRDFGDPAATRALIYQNVLDEARKLPPVENKLHTLALEDVDYDDPDDVPLRAQKRAILEGQTLSRRLRGTWVMRDKATGDELDRRKITLANVPHMTHRGTFILNGTEYTLANQMRLRPGVFTRTKDNGEIESHINVLPGKGPSSRVFLDPATSTFRLQLGQGKLPLISVLKALGKSDSDLRKEWGNELYYANARIDDTRTADKLYEKVMRSKADPAADGAARREALLAAFDKMELDPEVTRRTLGGDFKNVGADTLLATTRRLVAVNKGEAEPDDRDHLAYQNMLGPEDLFAERMRASARVIRPLLWKATMKRNLQGIQPGFLSRQVQAAITGSGLGQPLEEINPADVFDQLTRVSRLGEGGIPSIDSVPDEARSVQPSHFGFVDPLRTPESFKVGVDTRLAYMARKGKDGRVYTPFTDVRTGETVFRSPQDIADATIAFPGELGTDKRTVRALVKGKLRFVPRGQVDFALPEMEHGFSPLANMIPLKSTIKGQRVAMGSRMLTQALPLQGGESPLVQSGIPGEDDRSYEEHYGRHMGAVGADQDGEVVSVSPDGVKVRYADGTEKEHELYNHFPLNRKTYIHNTPVVQPGQKIKAGEILAKSNYTDAKGATALGLNMRTAYLPFRGLNFEDATVISRSAAKRLASEHMYQHDTEWDSNARRGKNAFVSLFASKFDRKTLDTMDDDGVVKPGTTVEAGAPLVLMAKERERAHNQVSRGKDSSFADHSLTWDHHAPGVVTDVAKTKKGVVVTVKSVNEMQVGDKLSGRYGDKGVIADIIDDDDMPRGPDGKPYEVLVNPLGVITRTNPGQMVEASLGKIAAITGKRYSVQDFKDIRDMVEYAQQELAKHGLSDTEDLVDPTNGRKIPGIFTGNRFFMKLHHTSESKGQGRGTGGYTAEEAPAKGGETGSKRVSMMDINAFLSHGATELARDAGAIRGQKNQDWWAAYMQGRTPPNPRVPLVYRKFHDQLRAAGINPVRTGGQTQIMALTNRDLDQLAGDRLIESSDTVDWKGGLKPIKGGLFDPALTGGHNGTRWSAIKLHEPLPNPIMEEPIRRILGLTAKRFEQVLAGAEEFNGLKGPAAISGALDRIDLDKEIEKARAEMAGSKKSARDAAVKRLAYLKSAKSLNLHPRDWVLDRVPVLPPAFRPVSVMAGNKQPMVADPNYLYKEVMDANTNLKEMQGMVDDVGEERLALYRAFKGVTGLGDPIQPKNQERQVKGVLKYVFGNSPKFGVVQRKLLGSTVDLVGRAVITPNPDLDMDQVGIPESKAWEIYKPFVVRRLVRRGVSPLMAAQMAKNQHQLARTALQDEMGERPVVITRAPVLHRYGTMAFYPRLVKGETLQVPPTIVKGFAADFDGDAMNYHVPVTEGAVRDAIEKMLPSKNLFSAATFKAMYLPQNEYTGGLYEATRPGDEDRPEQVFQTKADAIRAYQQGRINGRTRVVILQN